MHVSITASYRPQQEFPSDPETSSPPPAANEGPAHPPPDPQYPPNT